MTNSENGQSNVLASNSYFVPCGVTSQYVLLTRCMYVSMYSCSYDPTSNCWQTVSPMRVKRLGVGVAVLGGYLYAVGGSDGSTPLSSVEQ